MLTGREAGERGPDGTYPERTVNREVDDRLRELAEELREFGREDETPKEEEPAGEGDEENPEEV